MERAAMQVIATAGHVDHGKSTLVRGLTGVEPDRFAEERRRGLTIDLGFAEMVSPSGASIAFIDVPGHVRFIKNMLAGVGAVEACMFVVAANEGWKPQSEEHLRILDLVGVRRGVVVLTKVDLAGDDLVGLALAEVAEALAGTSLDRAEVVAVDATDPAGLDELRWALDRLVTEAPAAVDRGRPRLWVDRSFAIRGAGTVVTGTLTGGALAVGEQVEVATRQGASRVRIRGLQSFGRDRDVAEPGSRVALNLATIHHQAVRRGDVVVRPGQWHRTRRCDVSFRVLPGVAHRVSRRAALAAYVGSGERPIRINVLQGDSIGPGETGLVRMRLAEALPLVPGDRFVVRDLGRGETVGGGEVLDVDPVLPASRARPDLSVDRVVAERGWVDPDELERLTGERREPTVGSWVVDPARLSAARSELAARIEAAPAPGLDVAELEERDRAVLATLPEVVVSHGRARTAASDASERLDDHPFLAALEAAPFSPPSPAELGIDQAEVRQLVRKGRVLERDGLYFAPAAIERAAALVERLCAECPDGVTVGQLREAMGTTRKWAVPLAGLLDARGITHRRGDLRVPGPRMRAGSQT
jgi:selenocysteine-specific elongation factor